ncbi:peptidylprolyl isomerase [Campylobacter gastrosuis]|uniref:Peptidyl-prolyl cis-trans isomerase n=1 Tax=Campylobacter gastrosuis TaxID=2974576 RepID=A0ABT7HRE8_9BACT|nr:peptidylprolyl isomerase [Campylobacter gastrosuis]MDL0088988.1 peptidyl-prolyl cis-trans isomerase [Campylobacter gastrosuis]
MFKKAIFASLICSFALASQMVNGIVAVVENEPITLFEINKVKEQLKISDQKAFDLLIKDRLEQAQIKNLAISTTAFEINQKIEQIAKQNGLTMSQFRDEIELKQGIKFSDFKKDIERSILQEKLYKNIFSEIGKNLNEDNARSFFEANKGDFSIFKSIDVTLFKANNENLAKAQIRAGAKAISGVRAENLHFEYANINPRIAGILAATPVGSFTQILKSPDSFDTFYVRAKTGSQVPNFEDVKEQIFSLLYSMEQEKTAADYFEKLRAKAKIKMIRPL